VVARVSPGSPAAAADLKANDVIVTFDGTVVDDYHHVQRLTADAEVGKKVKVEIIRDRAKRTLDVKIAEAPDAPASSSPSEKALER
jgi:serine protease Do